MCNCIPDWFPSNFAHDVAFSTEVFVTETQEVVDDESLVTISERVKIDIVTVFVEEEERKPRSKSIDGDDEEDPDYPALLRGVSVKPQILVNL
jgi:hypothetical protein